MQNAEMWIQQDKSAEMWIWKSKRAAPAGRPVYSAMVLPRSVAPEERPVTLLQAAPLEPQGFVV